MKRMKYIIEYLCLFAVNAVMFWFFHGYLNLLIGIGMIVFLIYAFFSIYGIRKSLSLEIDVPAEYIPKNTEFIVKIRLKNKSILPLVKGRIFLQTGNVFAGVPKENVLTVPVKPRGVSEVCYPLTSSYVGNIVIRAEKIILEDLLGFHSVAQPLEASANLYIVPSGGDGKEYVLNDYEKGMDEVEESKLSGSDFSDVSQVREYMPGDAMKNIHWKLSAKRENLMVKERFHMSSRKLLAVLVIDRGDAEKLDETIETLFGFGQFCIANRVPVTLFWWSETYGETREETAESGEEWLRLMIHLFHTQAGNGFVEEHFRSMYPEKGCILIRNGEITTTG